MLKNYQCMTIHNALGLDKFGERLQVEEIDFTEFECIIVDELFRIDPFLLSKLVGKLRGLECNTILLGHISQNCSISTEKYDYSKSDAIGEIVNFNYFKFTEEEMIEKIKNGFCRYDMKTYIMLNHLEEFKNLDGFKFKPINPLLKTNICWTNKFKDKINLKFSSNVKIGDKIILNEHYTKGE